jgi:hypothetical protein
MRTIVSVLVAGLCMLIAVPAQAFDHDRSAATEMSAAKKKKPVRQTVRSEPQVAARRGWFDPSLGPDGKPYRNPYPPGTCSIDQGYGRFTTCDFHE